MDTKLLSQTIARLSGDDEGGSSGVPEVSPDGHAFWGTQPMRRQDRELSPPSPSRSHPFWRLFNDWGSFRCMS